MICEEVLRRDESPRAEPVRGQETYQGLAHRGVIINDKNYRGLLFYGPILPPKPWRKILIRWFDLVLRPSQPRTRNSGHSWARLSTLRLTPRRVRHNRSDGYDLTLRENGKGKQGQYR